MGSSRSRHPPSFSLCVPSLGMLFRLRTQSLPTQVTYIVFISAGHISSVSSGSIVELPN